MVASMVRVATAITHMDVQVAPRTTKSDSGVESSPGPSDRFAYLPAPLVRFWGSPLPTRQLRARALTYDQPGRWMDDEELYALHDMLLAVAKSAMHETPDHYLLQRENARVAFSNRVISIAVDEESGEPCGFSAMVYLPHHDEFVLHLGLTMIAKGYRGRRIQSPLLSRCLLMPIGNLFRKSYVITSIAASPAGIGATSDYFDDVYPKYNNERNIHPKAWQLDVARNVLGNHRHEFACSTEADFDEVSFVVRGSNKPEGGGAPQFIKLDAEPVSQYKVPECNKFCARALDLTKGDELFQVGRVDLLATSLKYVTSATGSVQKTKGAHSM